MSYLTTWKILNITTGYKSCYSTILDNYRFKNFHIPLVLLLAIYLPVLNSYFEEIGAIHCGRSVDFNRQ